MLTACGGGATSSESAISSLPSAAVPITQNLRQIAVDQNITLALTVALGSGAFHAKSDPVNVFYSITDRGPIVPCSESKQVLGKNNLCKNNGVTDNEGKIFLIPDYTPSIYKIRLNKNSVDILQAIPLTDGNQGVSGLTNPLRSAKKEKAYNLEGERLVDNPSGLDTEAMVRLNNGDFWLADEYAPGLVHVSATGRVISREVPQSIGDDLSAATYPVFESLPKIIRSRSVNRGIEALAVSDDQTQLFFMLQSPLANPTRDAFRNSRNVRVFSATLNADGSLGNVDGEYVYKLDKPKKFIFEGNTPEQNKIFISDMTYLPDGSLLIIERTNSITKIYKAVINDASNILAGSFDDKNTSPSLEETTNLSAVAITPVNKQLVYRSDESTDDTLGKVEGITVLDKNHLLLIKDNDYGVSGDITRVQVLTLTEDLF